jgi:hypothetical protein
MAKYSNTAHVARTSHDKVHVNRLSAPEYGVVEIRVLKGAAGSLSHREPGASTPRAPSAAGVDTFNFAPGPQYNPATWTEDPARHDRVKVWYDLHNPYLNITKAKLELFRRFDESAIWKRELKDEELLDGAHELEFEYDNAGATAKRKEWEGAIDSSKRFPDGVLTVEHSPYKLRLSVEGPGQSKARMAWTYVHVLIDHLELEWGVEDAIPSSKVERRQPFHDLLNPRPGGVAATPTSASIPIYLNSAIFMSRGFLHEPVFKDSPFKKYAKKFEDYEKTRVEKSVWLLHSSGGEMFDNTLFEKYKKMWADGPEIPLFCKIWIRDSSGAAVVAPQAIGNTKFLWDWESRAAAVPSTFASDAQNYDVAVTEPPGENCHKDRGGKRGTTLPVFPEQGGYGPRAQLKSADFPFEVMRCPAPRKWSAYSLAWREEVLAAKTGVLFQPSRMAGDKYRITVYAAFETADGKKPRLEVNTAAPLPIDPSLRAVSGDFEIWRRVPLIRYLKKTAGATDLTFANIAAYYQPAFLDLVDDSGGSATYNAANWNTRLAGAIADWTPQQQYMVDSTIDQHAAGDEGIIFRSPAQMHADLMASGWSAAVATKWMNDNGFSNVSGYSTMGEGLTRKALVKVFNEEFRDDIPGVNISQVSVTHNQVAAAVAVGPYSIIDGEAADYPRSDEHHCAFLSLLDSTQRATIGFASDSDLIAAHEFGHLFFLPHPAPVNGESGYNAHDTSVGVDNCVMSYNPNPRVFCGLCQLRLRGWDKLALQTTEINHKP